MTLYPGHSGTLARVFHIALCCIFLVLPLTPLARASDQNITLYTALTTTTPQMPLWAAIRNGWPQGEHLAVAYWKNLDDLRGIMLAGKGQVWVGHLEGFAQAALRGAPVTLVAVTGWRKFHFLAPKDETFSDMAALAEKLKQINQDLAVTPQDGPSVGILEETARRGGPAFSIAAMAPQQLMLEMLRGTRRYALLPEPLASAVMAKKNSLHAVLGLETEFAKLYGGEARLPLAGVAVHAEFAARHPDLVRKLVAAMVDAAPGLAGNLEAAIAVLPEEVIATLGRDVIASSLRDDMIHVLPAVDVREEIAAYLHMVMAKTGDAPTRLDRLLNGPFLSSLGENQ